MQLLSLGEIIETVLNPHFWFNFLSTISGENKTAEEKAQARKDKKLNAELKAAGDSFKKMVSMQV